MAMTQDSTKDVARADGVPEGAHGDLPQSGHGVTPTGPSMSGMDIKLIEIRDRGTFIPAMAIRLRNRTPEEFYLLRSAGYSAEAIGGPEELPGVLAFHVTPYIILVKLVEVEAHYDSFDWPNQRTMGNAHRHMIEHWADIASGDVVDVQFVLGETETPKISQRLSDGRGAQ